MFFPSSSALRATFASGLLFSVGLANACLPTTNIFDPSGPPDSLAPTFVNGSLAFDDGTPVEGVIVDIYRIANGDAGDAERVAASFEGGEDRASFSFEVPPDVTRVVVRPRRCGYSNLTFVFPDAYPEYPANLTPGSEFNLNEGQTVVMRRDPPSRRVTGRVEALDANASESGIKVILLEYSPQSDQCGLTVAETTTAPDGTFTIEPVADGTYIAVGFTEGTTVAISGDVNTCEEFATTGGVTPDVELPLMEIRGAAGVIALSAVDDDGTLPPDVINEPRVQVAVGGFFEWAEEMRLSEDPTFSTGNTGWVPVASPRVYPPGNGLLSGSTLTTVYAQFRSSCALSPLYSDSIIFDSTGPDIFRVRVRDVEAEGSIGAELVVIEGDLSVPLAIDGFDETGLRTMVQVTPRALGAELPPPQIFSALSGGGATLREQVEIPLEEGRYDLLIEIQDAAGNLADNSPYLFEVIRDTEPPTTPLPSVTDIVISGETAYVWLEERDCFRTLTGGVEESYRAFVCEENPRQFDFFEVRGGPAFLDFEGFDQPPFAVPVFIGEETDIEVRAVDDAGNPSESFGRVTVTHRNTRSLMTLPPTATLGPRTRPSLVATSGTAFFGVTPSGVAQGGTLFDLLVVQPSWLQPVGLERPLSPFPGQLRKLSVGTCNFAACADEQRAAAGLTAGEGRLFWLEAPWANAPSAFSTRAFTLFPDDNGLHDITDGALTGPNVGPDDEGEPAPQFEACDSLGRARCNFSTAWQGYDERRPGAGRFDRNLVAVPETGIQPRSLLTELGTPAEMRTVVGPRFIGAHLRAANAGQRLWGADFELQAEPESTLHFAQLSFTSFGDAYQEFGYSGDGVPSQSATGFGTERLITPLLSRIYTDDISEDGFLMGVFVPAGVTVTVPLFARAVPDAGPLPVTTGEVVFGTVDLPIDPTETRIELDGDSVRGALEPGLVPNLSMLRQDRDLLRQGISNGLTLIDLVNGESRPRAGVAQFVGDPPEGGPPERSMTTGPATETTTQFATATTLQTPEACATVFEVERTTAIRDIEVSGGGDLDSLFVQLYRSENDSANGRFTPYPMRGNLPPLFPSAHSTRLRTKGDPQAQCELLPGEVIAADTQSGSVPDDLFESGTTSGSYVAPLPMVSDAPPAGPDPVLIATLPVTEGDSFWIATRTPTPGVGDIDLHVGLGVEPTNNVWDCLPYLIGTDENCFVTVPAGVTEVFISVRGYSPSNPYDLYVMPPEPIDSRAIAADGQIYYQLTTSAPDFVARVGPSPITWSNYADYIDDAFSFASFSTDIPVTGEVFLGSPADQNWTLDYTIYDLAPVQIASYPVTPGDVFRADISGTGDALLAVRFDAPPTASEADCTLSMFSAFLCGGSDGLPVPDGVTTVFVAVRKGTVMSTFDISIEIAEAGCGTVAGYPGATASDASSELLPGTYLLTLANSSASPTDFDAAGGPPEIEVGLLATGVVGPLIPMGAASNPTKVGADLVLSGVSTSAPICQVSVKTTSLADVVALGVTDEQILAAVDTAPWDGAAQTTLYSAPAGDAVPVLTELGIALPEGRRVVALFAEGEHAWLVSAVSNGAAPAVQHLDLRSTTPPSEALTTVLDLDSVSLALRVDRALLDGKRAILSGQASTGPQLRAILLGGTIDAPTATVEFEESLSFRPSQVAFDRSDLFLWDPDNSGGELLHRDLRDVTQLYPGGQFEVAGFDLLDQTIALALTNSGVQLGSRLLILDESEGSLNIRQLNDNAVHTHVGMASASTLATLSADAGGARVLRLHSLESETSTTVVAASAGLAELAEVEVYDPLLASQEGYLAAGNGVVVVVGKDTSGSTLQVFEVPDDPATWPTLTPSIPSALLSSPPTSVVTDGTHLLTTLIDGTVDLRSRSTGTWETQPVPDPDQALIVGLVGGQLILLERPPLSAGTREPTTLRVGRADVGNAFETLSGIDAGSAADAGSSGLSGIEWIGRLPAGAFGHQMARVFQVEDELQLFDSTAVPPVLWGTQIGSEGFRVTEGPHRPLVTGNEAIGPQSAPRAGPQGLYWIRRGSSGNALMRMR